MNKAMLINVHKSDNRTGCKFRHGILYHHYSAKAYAILILCKLKTIYFYSVTNKSNNINIIKTNQVLILNTSKKFLMVYSF